MITAEGRMDLVNDMAAGTGHLKRTARSAHMRDLERASVGTARGRRTGHITRSKPDSAPADPKDFGIEVVVLKGVKTAPWPTAGDAADA